jgi:hypothetical protein
MNELIVRSAFIDFSTAWKIYIQRRMNTTRYTPIAISLPLLCTLMRRFSPGILSINRNKIAVAGKY